MPRCLKRASADSVQTHVRSRARRLCTAVVCGVHKHRMRPACSPTLCTNDQRRLARFWPPKNWGVQRIVSVSKAFRTAQPHGHSCDGGNYSEPKIELNKSSTTTTTRSLFSWICASMRNIGRSDTDTTNPFAVVSSVVVVVVVIFFFLPIATSKQCAQHVTTQNRYSGGTRTNKHAHVYCLYNVLFNERCRFMCLCVSVCLCETTPTNRI